MTAMPGRQGWTQGEGSGGIWYTQNTQTNQVYAWQPYQRADGTTDFNRVNQVTAPGGRTFAQQSDGSWQTLDGQGRPTGTLNPGEAAQIIQNQGYARMMIDANGIQQVLNPTDNRGMVASGAANGSTTVASGGGAASAANGIIPANQFVQGVDGSLIREDAPYGGVFNQLGGGLFQDGNGTRYEQLANGDMRPIGYQSNQTIVNSADTGSVPIGSTTASSNGLISANQFVPGVDGSLIREDAPYGGVFNPVGGGLFQDGAGVQYQQLENGDLQPTGNQSEQVISSDGA